MSKGSAQVEQCPRYKPYPKYKDSGVEWLGEIPEHWEVKTLKRLCLVCRGASPRPIEDPVYFDDEGEYAWVRIADVTASDRYLEYTTQKLSALGKSKSVPLEPGELFVSIAGTVGKPIITKIKCCVHDGFVYFIGLCENREYLYYVFSCGEPYKGLGKLGTQLNLNTDTIGDIYLPIPPGREQQNIVDALDQETAKIDALVAKKEKLIELLQEKRAALITQAVTKGLDPSLSMKDSGVEWLGTIPAHWEVKRIRDVAESLQTGPFGSQLHADEYVPGECPVINPANLQDGQIVPDLDCTVDEATAQRLEHHRLAADDIVLARRGELGRCGLVTQKQKGWVCGTGSLRLRPRRDVARPRFLMHLLSTSRVRDWLQLQSVGSTMQNLNTSIISRIPLALPNPAAQDKIVMRIDLESGRIDSLISKIHNGIERLKECRTALISAAVTGKIDVRGEVA